MKYYLINEVSHKYSDEDIHCEFIVSEGDDIDVEVIETLEEDLCFGEIENGWFSLQNEEGTLVKIFYTEFLYNESTGNLYPNVVVYSKDLKNRKEKK